MNLQAQEGYQTWCYEIDSDVFRHKSNPASRQGRRASLGIPTGRTGRSTAHYDGPTAGAADQAGPDDSGCVISPAPEWDAECDVGHDRVGTGSKAIRGYVPEEPATQREGTCARDCNNPLSAVVTVYGHQRQIREVLSLRRCDSI